ncbi:MAG TPA: adenylate/guanylate cyclase domain-containing protein [Actinomycetes bacterium]|nr:adenylate/guanylate cyclase domain-containing protein [Actinomycetes bacterium]
MKPETRYARSGEVSIAYQVVGEGPLDLVYVPGWVTNIELMWEEPSYARFLDRLASFSRLLLIDKRGTGLSDRVVEAELPTLEQRIDDVRAVMDAVGSQRAALVGHSEGGNMAVLFAATYPQRTLALVAFGIFATRVWSPDYPWAPTPRERQAWYDRVEQEWGGPVDLADLAPSVAGDERFRRWWATYLRQGASPKAALTLAKMNTQIDLRAILPTIRVPTLILHRSGDRDARIEEGRYIAARIPGARLVELAGVDHLPWVGDQDTVLDEVQEFLTGVRRELDRFHGRAVKTVGDGFLATFDGPARAIRCACAIRDALGGLGLQIRAGLHTGECELIGDDIGGIAVHIGARVAALAGPGEVLVSRTVKDLVAGSAIQFEDRGTQSLKGVQEPWRLFAVR